MTDIVLDTDDDLKLDANGSLVMGSSDQQHKRLLLATEKGQWKESPQAGVGCIMYLSNEDEGGLLKEIRTQFTADGMSVTAVAVDNNLNVIVDADYAG